MLVAALLGGEGSVASLAFEASSVNGDLMLVSPVFRGERFIAARTFPSLFVDCVAVLLESLLVYEVTVALLAEGHGAVGQQSGWRKVREVVMSGGVLWYSPLRYVIVSLITEAGRTYESLNHSRDV